MQVCLSSRRTRGRHPKGTLADDVLVPSCAVSKLVDTVSSVHRRTRFHRTSRRPCRRRIWLGASQRPSRRARLRRRAEACCDRTTGVDGASDRRGGGLRGPGALPRKPGLLGAVGHRHIQGRWREGDALSVPRGGAAHGDRDQPGAGGRRDARYEPARKGVGLGERAGTRKGGDASFDGNCCQRYRRDTAVRRQVLKQHRRRR